MITLPKYFIIKRDENNPLWDKYIYWLNETYRQEWTGSRYNYYGYDGNDKYNGLNCWEDIEQFQNFPALITLEEWNEWVSGFAKDMEEKAKYRTITPEQAQRIIDSINTECSWYGRLTDLWAVKIVNHKQIKVSESLYKEMRAAANDKQNALGDEIFGKDKKEITSDDLVRGEWMQIETSGDYCLKTNEGLVFLDGSKSCTNFTGKKVKIKSIQWEEVE